MWNIVCVQRQACISNPSYLIVLFFERVEEGLKTPQTRYDHQQISLCMLQKCHLLIIH